MIYDYTQIIYSLMKLPIAKLACAVCALSLASCAEEEMPSGARTNTTIEADIATEESRAAIDPTTYANNDLGLLWTPTDSLGVFGTGGTANTPFVNDETSRRVGRTTFSGNLNAGETPLYAYFPYSATAGTDATKLHGTLPGVQQFAQATGDLTGDYKWAVTSGGSGSNCRFTFRHVFAMLRVNIDASQTEIAGERLEAIHISVADRQLHGDFTFSAADGSYEFTASDTRNNTIEMQWTDKPTLGEGSAFTGYVNIAPTVKQGDVLNISVVTGNHQADFSMEVLTDLAANRFYTLPLTLALQQQKSTWKVRTRPTISTLSFTAAANPGKILDKELYIDAMKTTQVRAADDVKLEARDNFEFYAYIPYLNDRRLVPSFTVAPGAKVYSGATEVVSGKTVVDFLANPTLRVVTDGTYRDYTVRLENTGLPVVVIRQSESGDFSDAINIHGAVVNHFLDLKVRGKETKFVIDDESLTPDTITIYNADGSVDSEGPCGIRLRGNSTQRWDKKPFAVKMGTKTSILGMPAHKRWCLLANRIDRSMIRNNVALEMANMTNEVNGGNGIGWSPRGCNVEVVFNGRHIGNYFLCEQIKIDSNRVNINKEYDSAANTPFDECGFLLELDTNFDENCKFRTATLNLPVMFKDDVPEAYVKHVKQMFDQVEASFKSGDFNTIYGLIDINSIIDNWLIHEIAMNNEYKHPKSLYMTINGQKGKTPGDGKIHAACVWDFDWATFPNIANRQLLGDPAWKETSYTAFEYTSWTSSYPYVWIPKLMQDATFKNRVQERWKNIYAKLMAEIPGYIRRLGELNARSFKENDTMWQPDFSEEVKNGDEGFATYDEVIESMVTAFTARMKGLNDLITNGKF